MRRRSASGRERSSSPVCQNGVALCAGDGPPDWDVAPLLIVHLLHLRKSHVCGNLRVPSSHYQSEEEQELEDPIYIRRIRRMQLAGWPRVAMLPLAGTKDGSDAPNEA